MIEDSDYRGPVASAVEYLRLTSRQLRLAGMVVLLFTIGNLALALVASSMAYRQHAVAQAVAAGFALAALGWFDSLRRRGDGLFQTLSDELQRDFHDGEPTREDSFPIRLAVREFVGASHLPLVAGSGPTIYFVLNVLIALVGSLVPRIFW